MSGIFLRDQPEVQGLQGLLSDLDSVTLNEASADGLNETNASGLTLTICPGAERDFLVGQ